MLKRQIALWMVIGLFFSCSNDDGIDQQTMDMRINHYQNTGMAVGPVLTLLVQEGDNIGTDNWTKFYTHIEGFDYVPGKIYDLSVRVGKINNPPADGSSLRYTLLAVKSTQEVGDETLFDIDLKINGRSFMTTTSGYRLLDQIEIDCNMLCNGLDLIMQHEDFVVGTFKRLAHNEIQLIALK